MRGEFREKEFFPRNSVLTDLFEDNHFRPLYNVLFITFSILLVGSAFQDYLETGAIDLGFEIMQLGFGQFFDAVKIWVLMQLSTFAIFFGFYIWTYSRYKCMNYGSVGILDFISLGTFIVFQLAFIVIPAKYSNDHATAPASGLMIFMEQARMLMKTHAFVRSSAPRVLSRIPEDEVGAGKVYYPNFFKFLYFMFAPTLIYRDDYPRSKKIRWKIVCWNFAEVGMMILCMTYVLKHLVRPHFQELGVRIFEFQFVILTILRMMLPVTLIHLFIFYVMLHSWQNGFAELLRFADRRFYGDWWNCKDFNAYYRSWNLIVHEWLYTYIYKDVHEKLRISKNLSVIAAFLISAAFHEFIIGMSFRFIYPILFVFFGIIGLVVFFLSRKRLLEGNFSLWYNLISGNGIISTLYALEYYARLHCPSDVDPISDLIVPRSWTCHNNVTDSS